MTGPPLLLVLDLVGTFAFGLNGALTAVRVARLDIVGVLALGVITALGGGIIRDVLIGAIPPATFRDSRYMALAVGGALVAFGLSRRLDRLETPIVVLDAVGLSVFAVIGAEKALEFGLGVGPAILLGGVTGVGGGVIRDALVGEIPVGVARGPVRDPCAGRGRAYRRRRPGRDLDGLPAALGAATVCFAIRLLGVRFRLNAPGPPDGGPRAEG